MKKLKKFVSHPLFSGSAIMIGGSMFINVINYFYHLIFGRLLGPVDYGILASLYSLLYIVGIVPTSTSVAIVKFISSCRNDEDISLVYKSLNKFILLIALILAGIMLISSSLIANFLHIDNVFSVVLISPILFFSLITLINQATSQGILKFMGFILPAFVSSIGKLLLGVLFIILGFSVSGAMGGVLLGAIFAYLISTFSIREITNRNIKRTKYDFKPFLKYSLPVFLQALAFTSIFTTDVILVKHFFSPFDAGIYAALSTLGKIVFFASAPISSVMFPVVAGRSAKGEGYLKIFWGSLGLTLFVSGSAVGIYYLFSDFAINILYGSAYLAASRDLVWMGLFILVYTLALLLVNFALSLGETRIIVFPVLAAFGQAILLWIFHSSIREVIQVSLAICTLMLFGEGIFLGYNSRYGFAKKKIYGKS